MVGEEIATDLTPGYMRSKAVPAVGSSLSSAHFIFSKDTDRDYFMSAEEAAVYKLIDRVITEH
jgi:ATP-dependent protease ClpP protease subunit